MKQFCLAVLLLCPWLATKTDPVSHCKSWVFQTPSKPPVDVPALIQAAAAKHNVRAAVVKSIVAAESNFDCDAVSPKGAVGLMQLMPDTASQFGVDPAVPAQNIDGGTRYIKFLLNKYHRYRDGLKRAIAAYNAGPAVVDRYRGIPPFHETRVYVARVLQFLKQFEKADG